MHIFLMIAMSFICTQSYAIEAIQPFDGSELETYNESLTEDALSTNIQGDSATDEDLNEQTEDDFAPATTDEQSDAEEISDVQDAQDTKELQLVETTLTDIVKSLETEEQKSTANARNLSFITKTIANYKALSYHLKELIDGSEDRAMTLGYIELCINDIDFLLSDNNTIGLNDETRSLIQTHTNKSIKSGKYEGSVKHVLEKIIEQNKQKMLS